MKKSFLALAIIAACGFAYADQETVQVARSGNDSVTLLEKDCREDVRVASRATSMHKHAVVVSGGQRYDACWMVRGDVIHLVYPDGDQGIVARSEFRPELPV
jgi:hypothetical protein